MHQGGEEYVAGIPASDGVFLEQLRELFSSLTRMALIDAPIVRLFWGTKFDDFPAATVEAGISGASGEAAFDKFSKDFVVCYVESPVRIMGTDCTGG